MRQAWIGVAVASGAMVGCGGLQRPSASVGPATVTEATAEGARVVVPVELRNPNATPLPITGTRYTLTVEGREPFRFEDRSAATIPAEGAQTLTLPAAFAARGGDLAGRPYRLEGSVVYEPPGEIRRVLTDTGVPLPSVGFSASGRLAASADTQR